MLIGKICYHSALWCSDHKTVLDKIRLVNIFYRSGILPDGSCQCVQSHRSALKLFNNQETGYSSTSEEDLIAKELEMLIDELVGGMPEQRRMIYTLSRNEGLSNAEIAERLNTTKRNVESQLSLALKEIRKVISCFLVSLL